MGAGEGTSLLDMPNPLEQVAAFKAQHYAALAYSLYDLRADVILDAPWRLVSVIGLGLGLFWLLRSKTLPRIFSEWPEPVEK